MSRRTTRPSELSGTRSPAEDFRDFQDKEGKIVYLLLVEGVSPSNIVAFTFTERTAQSMKGRVYQRLEGLGESELVKHLGEMYVGTIHSFCLRALEDYFGYGVMESLTRIRR